MAQKTKIEYVSRYYSYGSEAQKVETVPVIQTLRSRLPEIKLEKFQKIYVDPLGLAGLAVAVCMLVLLIMGAYHMRDTRAEYDALRTYVSDLKRENATLSHIYHTSYDLDTIRDQARKIGMVDAEETECFTVFFSVPESAKKPTAWDDFVWLISGLLSNPKR